MSVREVSFETVASGLHMTRPIRPSTLRAAVDYLKTEGVPPSISPDAGQNRQMFSPPTSCTTTLEEGSS